jgi:hypothetical protein
LARGKKKSKSKAKLFSILAVVIVAIGVGTFVTFQDTDAPYEKTIEITQLSFTGGNSNNENGAVYAKVKQTTYAVDSSAKILLSDESTGIEGNPILPTASIVDPSTGKDLASLIAIPKIWFDYPTAWKPEITLDPSTLYVTVLSQDANGNWKQTAQKSFTTFSYNFKPGSPEVSIGSIGIQASDIESKLPKGTYNSLNRISVHGDLKMHYTTAPSVTMTIPIGANDLKSWYTGVITADAPLDTDGDGIIDANDQCNTEKENFNGYEDTDGCFDTKPTSDPPVVDNPTVNEPTGKETCENGGGIWSGSDATNGVCTTVTSNNGGTGTGTGTLTIPQGTFVVVDLETNYQDGSKTHEAFTTDDSGIFDVAFNSIVDLSSSHSKTSASGFIYRVYLGTFGDSLQGLKISDSDLKFTGNIDIASKDLFVGTKIGTGGTTSEAKTLTLATDGGQVVFKGILVSQATFTSVDLHNAVNNYDGIELVPSGSSRSFDFDVDIDGAITLKSSSVSSSGTTTGTLSGASVSYSGLTLINQVAPKGSGSGIYNSFSEAESACGGSTNVKSIGGGQYQCINSGNGLTCEDTEYVATIEGTETCLPKGATCENNAELVNGECPKPIVTQPGTVICTDASDSGKGGFPCEQEYRDLWCNGTTTCEVPPSATTPQCNDASCLPVTGDGDGDSCTDPNGNVSIIKAGVCVNVDPTKSDGDPGDFCTTAQSCIEKQFNIDLNDPMTLGVIVVGAIAGLFAVLKKDSKYSPIPASRTQFSQ